jgi:hypothetical protein
METWEREPLIHDGVELSYAALKAAAHAYAAEFAGRGGAGDGAP